MSEQQVFTASPANRRRARRCPLGGQTRIECRQGCAGMGRNVAVSTLDVSQTGARLTALVPLARGQEVELQLTGPGLQKPVRRSGKVAWSVLLEDHCYAIGVAFDKPLAYADLQRIARL